MEPRLISWKSHLKHNNLLVEHYEVTVDLEAAGRRPQSMFLALDEDQDQEGLPPVP